MNGNEWIKRIGALPLTIAMVFALSVNAGWSQIGGAAVTKIIPQVAVGTFDGGLTKYSTVIEIVNPNPISVTVEGNFYKEDGTAANLTLATNSTAMPTISNGTLPQVTLDPNKVLIISAGTTAATTPSTGTIAWARLVTSGAVSSATFFELRDGRTSALQSRVGVQASPTNMAKFVIPRVRNVAAGLDVGFALVNTAVTSASLTVTLKDAAGGTIAARSLTMPGSSHRALFTVEFFELTNEPNGTNYNYIVFDAGSAAQFAAVALAFEGAAQTSLPVDVLR